MRFFPVLIAIALTVITRTLPHPPNFTALNSLPVFLGRHSRKVYGYLISVLLTLASLILSDLIIGDIEKNFWLRYLLFCSMVFIPSLLSNLKSWLNYVLSPLAGSIYYFIVSNFFVWLTSGMYEKTLEGILLCYLYAIPFGINSLLSTYFYFAIMETVLFTEKKVSKALHSKKLITGK